MRLHTRDNAGKYDLPSDARSRGTEKRLMVSQYAMATPSSPFQREDQIHRYAHRALTHRDKPARPEPDDPSSGFPVPFTFWISFSIERWKGQWRFCCDSVLAKNAVPKCVPGRRTRSTQPFRLDDNRFPCYSPAQAHALRSASLPLRQTGANGPARLIIVLTVVKTSHGDAATSSKAFSAVRQMRPSRTGELVTTRVIGLRDSGTPVRAKCA